MLFHSDKVATPLEEQIALEAQKKLETISPLVRALYRNAAAHIIHKGLSYVEEFLFYIAGIACFIFIFIMNTVFPFHVLGDIIGKRIYEQANTNLGDISAFDFAVKGLVILIGFLFIYIGMRTRSSRNTKSLLQQAAIELKNIEAYFVEKQKQSKSKEPVVKAMEIEPTVA